MIGLAPLSLQMKCFRTIAEKRCEPAIQIVLELVSWFEAGALWDLVEASRAIIVLLREGNVSGACRLCLAIDPGNRPHAMGGIPGRLLERWMILEYLLCSMATEDSEEQLQAVDD